MKTEIPEGMKLTRRAKKILTVLEREFVCIFETDDNPDDYNTTQQIYNIAGSVGYDILCQSHFHIIIIDRKKVRA